MIIKFFLWGDERNAISKIHAGTLSLKLEDFSGKSAFSMIFEVMRSISVCEHHNKSKKSFSREFIFFSKNFNFYDFLTINGQPTAYHLGSMAKFEPFLADFSFKNSVFYRILKVMRCIPACEHHIEPKICFSRGYIFFSKNFNFYDVLTINGQPRAYHLDSMAKFEQFLADFSLLIPSFGQKSTKKW